MILTDTGYWLALANRKDKFHQQAIDVTKTIDSELIITWPVITEVCHLLSSRMSTIATVKFLQQLELSTTLFELNFSHLHRIQILMKKYQDLPMDMADASLIICAEELKTGDIFSTDCRDFDTCRWKNHYPFNNLFFPET